VRSVGFRVDRTTRGKDFRSFYRTAFEEMGISARRLRVFCVHFFFFFSPCVFGGIAIKRRKEIKVLEKEAKTLDLKTKTNRPSLSPPPPLSL